MAAPSHLFTHKVVSQKTGRADKLVLLTSAAETSTVLKARFYLDGFFIREHNGVKKWAGYCIVGSTNYYMHSEARHSWLRERRNGQDIVVFWDAGLNTFGQASLVGLRANIGYGVHIDVSSKAAYYVDTDSVRFKARTYDPGATWVSGMEPVNQTAATESNYTINWNIPLLDTTFTPGKAIELMIESWNAEGTYSTNVIATTLPPASGIFTFSASWASSAYNNYMNNSGRNTYYFGSYHIAQDDVVSNTANLTNYISAGYLANDQIWLKIGIVNGKSVILTAGIVGYWEGNDPANPQRFVESNYRGYRNNWSTGCILIDALNPVTIWWDNTDQVFRKTNTASGALADTGFYYLYSTNPGGFNEFIYINNGQYDFRVFNCNDGYTP